MNGPAARNGLRLVVVLALATAGCGSKLDVVGRVNSQSASSTPSGSANVDAGSAPRPGPEFEEAGLRFELIVRVRPAPEGARPVMAWPLDEPIWPFEPAPPVDPGFGSPEPILPHDAGAFGVGGHDDHDDWLPELPELPEPHPDDEPHMDGPPELVLHFFGADARRLGQWFDAPLSSQRESEPRLVRDVTGATYFVTLRLGRP